MSTSAVSLEKARRSAIMRVMTGVLIGLAIVSGLMYTVIPRPERPDNWRLWVWFGQRWGAQPAWMGAGQGWVYWWAGKPYAAEREDDTNGGLVWEMAMDGGDQWTLRVYQPGVEWNELMRPFNAIKRDMFGIVFTSEERKTCDGPFEVAGDRIDVMSALARTYGLRAKSFVMTSEQSYVWVFDASRGRMQPLDIEAAEALAYEVDRRPNPYESRKLIPRPGSEAGAAPADPARQQPAPPRPREPFPPPAER
jgi:hypothetical protein